MSHPVQKGKQVAFEAGIFKGFIPTGYDFPRFAQNPVPVTFFRLSGAW
jgi:hypothetical protein